MIARQWYSASDDCVTIRSNTSHSGCDLIQSVIVSPRNSRSRALVAENTFNPIGTSLDTVRERYHVDRSVAEAEKPLLRAFFVEDCFERRQERLVRKRGTDE